MLWSCRKVTDGAAIGMLNVTVLQEIYRCFRGRQECYIWWCSRKATNGTGKITLDVVCCGNAAGGAGTRIIEVVQREDRSSICCANRDTELL